MSSFLHMSLSEVAGSCTLPYSIPTHAECKCMILSLSSVGSVRELLDLERKSRVIGVETPSADRVTSSPPFRQLEITLPRCNICRHRQLLLLPLDPLNFLILTFLAVQIVLEKRRPGLVRLK
uniref:Uncharacterized protein n=1 Tax=Steinernema glaseri TaxID=37863 RepID=A0A1I8AA19_9BILA